jgi:hypoxanthine-guanine phosphoribosyltransferase
MPKTARDREKIDKMASYDDQIRCHDYQIDPIFWENPYGVDVAHDNLKFLFIPDHVSAFIAAKVAHKVYRYQIDNIRTKAQITHAVMITMGGLLPGVMLYDHLAWTLNKNIPPIEFGTLGVKYYAGPGQPLDKPRIVLPVSIDVKDRVVGVIEDLVDLGGTARFVAQYLVEERQAAKVVLVAPYLKSTNVIEEMHVIFYGHVPKDTWIITPRERVETLIKRVPFWRDNGATLEECENNLHMIGYPDYLLETYLRATYERG